MQSWKLQPNYLAVKAHFARIAGSFFPVLTASRAEWKLF